jgi:hypothetical protein
MLKEDHRKVEGLFAEFESADEARQEAIIKEACQDLIIHSLLEERIFYPAARNAAGADKLNEAQVEHDAAKVLIVELLEGDRSDRYRKAKFKVLAEEIKQHVKEEEAADGVLAKAQKAGVSTPELGEHMADLKHQLQQKAQSGRLPEPEPASFRHLGEMERHRPSRGMRPQEEDYRYAGRSDYERERRYEPDERQGGRYGRGYPGDDEERRFRERDDDERRRRDFGRSGTYGEPGGQWRGERGGYAGSGRGRDWDDDRRRGGWASDPEGYSDRRDWERRR